MLTRIPPIRKFPKDDRVWRIDWLGRVERTSAEALIDVHLSPARMKTLRPRRQDDFDADTAIKIRIGVGLLPFLTIGSLWTNGRKLQWSLGEPRRLRNVDIQERIPTATAGQKVQEQPIPRWLIPKFRHQLDRSCWFSPLFAIEHEGDPYGILLPMIEAIRFYYAVSSDMAHIAFDGGLQLNRNRIIDPESRLHANRMELHLRQWLADDDGWVIGRALADPHAEEGIAFIYNSLLRDTANFRTAFAECLLPFVGQTIWTTRGIELPRQNSKGSRWLIYELINCSAPFPFEDLKIVRDNDGRTADPETDVPNDEKRPAWSPGLKAVKPATETEVQSDDPPQANLQGIELPSASERFTALHGKQIIKAPKEQCQYKKVEVPATEAVDLLGTGDPSNSDAAQGGAPVSVEWLREVKRQEALPASFESLQTVMDALNCLDGISARIRTLSPSTEFLRLTRPSGQRQWSYLDSARRIRRRAMVINIDCNGILGCLIEYERRESERSRAALFVAQESDGLSDALLIRLLDGLVAAEGVWANLKSYPAAVELKLFNHSRTSADTFAADIRNAMETV